MPIKEWGKLHSTAEKNWVKKTARWKQMCYLLSKKWSNKATYLLLLQKNCSCTNTEQKGERYCRLKAELKFAFPRYHFPYFLLYLLSKGSTSLSYRLENSIYDSWKSKEVNSNYTYISKKHYEIIFPWLTIRYAGILTPLTVHWAFDWKVGLQLFFVDDDQFLILFQHSCVWYHKFFCEMVPLS